MLLRVVLVLSVAVAFGCGGPRGGMADSSKATKDLTAVVEGNNAFALDLYANLREETQDNLFGNSGFWVEAELGLCPRPRDFLRHDSDVQR